MARLVALHRDERVGINSALLKEIVWLSHSKGVKALKMMKGRVQS